MKSIDFMGIDPKTSIQRYDEGFVIVPDRVNVLFYTPEGRSFLIDEIQKDLQEADADPGFLSTRIAELDRAEKDINTQIATLLKALAEKEAERLAAVRANEIFSAKPCENTGCEWVETRDGYEFTLKCSNDVFASSIACSKTYSDTKPWRVYTSIHTKSPFAKQDVTLKNTSKDFECYEDAMKYIDGRKAFVTKKCFTEQRPPVPFDCKSAFMRSGIPLPGYRYKDTID